MEPYINQFLEALRSEKGCSDNTTSAYRNDLTQLAEFLRLQLGATAEPAHISPELIANYVNDLQIGPQAYAMSTVARKIAAIKSFFHFLIQQQIITADPSLRVISPKVQKQMPKILNAEEIEQLLTAPTRTDGPKALRDAALLAVLYATGLRVTEVVNLRLEDVNWDEATLACRGRGERERHIPLGSARDVLNDYLTRARPLLARDGSPAMLFLNHRGQKLTRQGVWLIIKETAQLAGVGGEVTPHTLRHSFAKHLISSGENVRRVQELLGHANLSTTQAYQQLTPEPPPTPNWNSER